MISSYLFKNSFAMAFSYFLLTCYFKKNMRQWNTMTKNKRIKIVVGYPPIESKKGVALLSQNRQFQYFNAPTYIYPMVPAYAATLLKENGDDVSYVPYEIFENSPVDYAIKGGDYDFVVTNLLNHIHKGEKLEGGVYWRASNKDVKAKPEDTKILKRGKKVHHSGVMSLKHNLDDLPFVDRDLTKWRLYAYANGNYKYTPGTYMYSGRDCWWNKCTFCVWDHTINPIGSYRSFSPKRLFAEVKHVVDKYGVKEIFDDAGTMFVGNKLKAFCELLVESGYNKKVKYGCNMRFNAIPKQEL